MQHRNQAWATVAREQGLRPDELFAIRNYLPYHPRWRAEEIRHRVQVTLQQLDENNEQFKAQAQGKDDNGMGGAGCRPS